MNTSQDDLHHRLSIAAKLVEIGAEYVHYKSDTMRYKVIDIAINTDSSDSWVVYRALYGEGIVFTRSVSQWCETVHVNGNTVQRFTRTV